MMGARGKPIPAYGEADLEAARAVVDQGWYNEPSLLREIAGAVRTAREEGKAAALEPLRKLLLEPKDDGPVQVFYRVQPLVPPEYLEVECLDVPVADVRAAFAEAEATSPVD